MSASLSTEEKRNEENQAPCTNAFNQADNLKVKPNDNTSNMLLSSSSSLPPSSGHVQSSAATPLSQATYKSFTVPKTSGQFQADWRAFQKDPDQLFHYFKVRSTWITMLMYVYPCFHRLHVHVCSVSNTSEVIAVFGPC